jgi:hypothetical protein
VDPQACETGKTGANPKTKSPEKLSVFPGSAFSCDSLRVLEVLRQGFETPPKNTGKQADSEMPGAKAGARGLEAITEALASLPPDKLAAVLAAALQQKPVAN